MSDKKDKQRLVPPPPPYAVPLADAPPPQQQPQGGGIPQFPQQIPQSQQQMFGPAVTNTPPPEAMQSPYQAIDNSDLRMDPAGEPRPQARSIMQDNPYAQEAASGFARQDHAAQAIEQSLQNEGVYLDDPKRTQAEFGALVHQGYGYRPGVSRAFRLFGANKEQQTAAGAQVQVKTAYAKLKFLAEHGNPNAQVATALLGHELGLGKDLEADANKETAEERRGNALDERGRHNLVTEGQGGRRLTFAQNRDDRAEQMLPVQMENAQALGVGRNIANQFAPGMDAAKLTNLQAQPQNSYDARMNGYAQATGAAIAPPTAPKGVTPQSIPLGPDGRPLDLSNAGQIKHDEIAQKADKAAADKEEAGRKVLKAQRDTEAHNAAMQVHRVGLRAAASKAFEADDEGAASLDEYIKKHPEYTIPEIAGHSPVAKPSAPDLGSMSRQQKLDWLKHNG